MGGVDSGYEFPTSQPPPLYYTTLYDGKSAGVTETVALDFSTVEIPAIGLEAPNAWRYVMYNEPMNGYQEPKSIRGTSYSARVVSGLAALLKQRLKSYWNRDDARELMANVLLLGDSYYGGSYSLWKYVNYISPTSGFGRAHAHFPGSPDLGADSLWYSSPTLHLSLGQTVSIFGR